jgi:hypothetical protein
MAHSRATLVPTVVLNWLFTASGQLLQPVDDGSPQRDCVVRVNVVDVKYSLLRLTCMPERVSNRDARHVIEYHE